MECSKCKKTLSKKGSHFICQGQCAGTFHRACVRGLAADMKAGKIRNYCNNCEEDDLEVSEDEEVTDVNHKKLLREILKKVSVIPGVQIQLSGISESLSLLSDKYDKMLSEQEELKTKVIKMEKNMYDLTNRCTNLEKCNVALEQKLQEYDQSSRRQNIEIAGVEQLPNEDTSALVKKIGKELKLPTEEILWARRLPQRKEGKISSIIVSFRQHATDGGGSKEGRGSGAGAVNSPSPRDAWLAQRRTRVLLCSNNITGGTSNSKIYINEDLNKFTRELLWKTKNMLRNVYKFIWVSKGRILVRNAGENVKAHWIRSEKDISELLNKANK